MHNQITQKEMENRMEVSPELNQFVKRKQAVEEMVNYATNEKSLELMARGFKIALEMQDQLSADMLNWCSSITDKSIAEFDRRFDEMTANTKEWKAISERLKETLEQERQAANEMMDSLSLALTINPREAYENIILRHVERKKKTESGDGFDNWQWTLKFGLKARLNMAWKIIFGGGKIG